MYRLIFLTVFLSLCTQRVQAQLANHVEVTQESSTWVYTVFNDELPGSSNYLSAFGVSVNAPITVIDIPIGWAFQTDNISYVLWYNTDTIFPYPHDVPPGASLSGFGIESIGAVSQTLEYGISSWDHITDTPGPSATGSVLAPGVVSVPEPSGTIITGTTAITLIAIVLRRRRKLVFRP